MYKLLEKYINQEIGINVESPTRYQKAKLVEVTEDYLTVLLEKKGIYFTFPLRWVLNIITAKGGNVSIGVLGKDYPVVIEVYHLVVYSGGIGVGF